MLLNILYHLLLVSLAGVGGQSNESSNLTHTSQGKKNSSFNRKTLSQLTWASIPNLTDNDLLPNGQGLGEYELPFNMSSKFVYYLAGYDFDDQPIWIIEAGNWNILEPLNNGRAKELDIYFKQFAFRALREIRKRSTPERPITKDVLILDFANMQLELVTNLKSLAFAIQNLREATYIIKTFTAEVTVINANFATEIAIRHASPILGGFFENVNVFGNNKEKWIPKLLRMYPKNALPEWYGGDKDFKPLKVYG